MKITMTVEVNDDHIIKLIDECAKSEKHHEALQDVSEAFHLELKNQMSKTFLKSIIDKCNEYGLTFPAYKE